MKCSPSGGRLTWSIVGGVLESLGRRGLVISDRLAARFDPERLEQCASFLTANPHFFSEADGSRILERHLFESMVFADRVAGWLEEAGGRDVSRETILDVGSGPGLPGLLFACLRSSPAVILNDSSRRRLSRVEQGLDSVLRAFQGRLHFSYERVENLRGRYPLVVARAFLPFPYPVELVTHLQRPGDCVFLALGRDPETDASRTHLQNLGYVSRETIALPELDFLGHRSVKILLRKKQHQKGYPRSWPIVQRELRARNAGDRDESRP